MIPTTSDVPKVSSFGLASAPVSFSIQANKAAFKILSSNVYTDKILAVCRELFTNGWDAHIVAGNTDKAIKVHLPNALEPFFSIRDFGTGLSHENMEVLYSTYFSSTKRDNNSQTGCLGIGSKSPFAYTDSFEVVSYYDGRKRVYVAFTGDDGAPKLNLLNDEDTEEDNGLEIIISVNATDYSSFSEKLAQATRFFPLPPEVVGAANWTPARLPDKTIASGEGWAIYPHYLNNIRGATVVMGNIGYPISNLYSQSAISHTRGVDDVIKALLASPLVVRAPLGSLDIAASREELSFDPKTVATLRELLLKVAEDFKVQLVKGLNLLPCLWDVRSEILKITRGNWSLRTVIEHEVVKGTTIKDLLNAYFSCNGTQHVTHSTRNQSGIKITKRSSYVGANDGTVFLYRKPTDTKVMSRIGAFFSKSSENAAKSIILINGDEVSEQEAINAFKITPAHIIQVSSLDVPARAIHSYTGVTPTVRSVGNNFFQFSVTNNVAHQKMSKAVIDKSVPEFFVIHEGGRCLGSRGWWADTLRLVPWTSAIRDFGLDELLTKRVFLVTKTQAESLKEENPAWTSFGEYVVTKLDTFAKTQPDYEPRLAIAKRIPSGRGLVISIFQSFKKAGIPLPSAYAGLEDKILDYYGTSSSPAWKNLVLCYQRLSNSDYSYAPKLWADANRDVYSRLFNDYPLLSVMEGYRLSEKAIDDIRDYMIALDKMRSTKS
jgi:hypothetical protein